MKFMNRIFSFFEKEKTSDTFEKYLAVRNEYLILKNSLKHRKRKKLISLSEIEHKERKLEKLLERKR